jgi:hypothetical protein
LIAYNIPFQILEGLYRKQQARLIANNKQQDRSIANNKQ